MSNNYVYECKNNRKFIDECNFEVLYVFLRFVLKVKSYNICFMKMNGWLLFIVL